MTKYRIRIYSKDDKLLDHFLKFLKRKNKTQNFQQFLNIFRQKKIKKKVTVLKSPHVNKTAQEQFAYTIYSIEISCHSWEVRKYIVFLKKVRNDLFPGINIKINGNFLKGKISLKETLFYPVKVAFYNSASVSLKQTIKSRLLNISVTQLVRNKSLLKKTLCYFNVLDCYGSLK